MEYGVTTPLDIRRSMIRMLARSEGRHIAANLSIVEILHTLYFRVLNVDPLDPHWPDRDRFLSKGHAAAALFTVLAARGFFPREKLAEYNTDGSDAYPVVDMYSLPGVEASTTSMGRGLSLGIGMALAAKVDRRPYQVYVLLGDGECQEGNVWEAAMLAPSLTLDNLTVIVDNNGLQGASTTRDVMDMSNLSERFRSFGWEAYDVDGHDPDMIEQILRLPGAAPKCVIAHTVKGKGVSMMENDVSWHHRSMTRKEVMQALRELG